MMGVNGEKCWRSEGLECGERVEIAGFLWVGEKWTNPNYSKKN